MKISRKLGLALLVSTFLGGTVGTAMANDWRQDHPRRAEINHRLGNQNARIGHDLATGKITATQAAQLRRDDHMVRSQERFDASLDRSHLTRPEQRGLNQDENAISRDIYRDAH